MGYDVFIEPINSNGFINVKAVHPYKDIIIKKSYLDYSRSFISQDIRKEIKYMERIKD
jgi:hypothetical protein|tara:strand:- start:37 stop:210 length:174 start_codon:yes stop_codon:yes gene_type:complete